MTPAPTTTIECGIDFKFRIPSESTTRSSSKSTPAGRLRPVPGAVEMFCPPPRELVGGVLHRNGVVVDESTYSGVQADAIAHELVAHHVDFPLDDVLGP